ncbi:MAG TPA: alpha-lytic protease prodomain-containing protein [Intrasporangium sp.]|nr:alpha-lytic protease prodomain-containing protein [Intrasporangium sp.]
MSEHRLRKALGAVNDLEPPRDDLFVERAMSRGRARAHQRRSWLVGAAAAVVIVGAVGGTWVAGHQGQGMSASSAGAPEVASAQSDGSAARGPSPAISTAPVVPHEVPPARDLSGWFTGPMTPVRAAVEQLAPTLEARFPAVFAGAYAADAGNTRIVLCVTRSNPDLEALVRSSVPAGSDVEYRTVTHSISQLQGAVARVESERAALQAQGVTVLAVRVDARSNRVVVTTTGDDHGRVASLVDADLVTVVVYTSHTPGQMLPGGSTVGPLQR